MTRACFLAPGAAGRLSVVVPDNMVPKGQVVAGAWYVWAGGRWASTNAPDAAQNVTVPRLEVRNRTTPVRPGSVSIPAPQHVQLIMVYEQRVIRVLLTLAYELNPTYDPRRYQEYLRGLEACEGFGETRSTPRLLSYLLLPLAAVVLLVSAHSVVATSRPGKHS